MTLVQRLLIAADLLAVVGLAGIAVAVVRAFSQPANPTGPGTYLLATAYLAGPPLLVVGAAVGGARVLVGRGAGMAATALLALPLPVAFAWFRFAIR